MFVQKSRNLVSSTSNFTTNQAHIDFDNDKIKINKFDIYHENRDKLNDLNQLIEASVEFDNKLYEQTMKKRNSISHERFDVYEVFEDNYRTQKSCYDKKTIIIVKTIMNQC